VAKALLLDGRGGEDGDLVREVLAQAGCVDIEALTLDEALRREHEPHTYAIAAVYVDEAALGRLHKLVLANPALPVVAIADESRIDAVLVAGASECVTKPIRRRELLGRVRCAMREREEAIQHERREGKLTGPARAPERGNHEPGRPSCVPSGERTTP